jgi:ADP-ribose pyrophosphatase YjhB (NUDIX family)
LSVVLRRRSGYSLGVASLVIDAGRILLVRRMHEPNRGRWTLPSGYVDAEELVHEAAAREVLEETGLRIEPVGVVGLRQRVSPNDNNLLLFFLMRPLPEQPAPVPDGVEVDAAIFVPCDDALANPDFIEMNKRVLRKVMADPAAHFSPEDCPPTPGLAALAYIAFL